MIIFTKHAREKFKILAKHKFKVLEVTVLEAVTDPDVIDKSRLPLLIAQKQIDKKHVLRVVYKQETLEIIKIITFYPGRVKQYK